MINKGDVVTIHNEVILDKIFTIMNGVTFKETQKANSKMLDMVFSVAKKEINKGYLSETAVAGLNHLPKKHKYSFNQFLVIEIHKDYFNISQLYRGLLPLDILRNLEKIEIKYSDVYQIGCAN